MMPQLRLAVEAKARVAGLHCHCKPVLLQASMWNNEGLLPDHVIFEESESCEACPYMIGSEIETKQPILHMTSFI
jgi:hypothetical protein